MMSFTIIATSDLHGEYGRFQRIADEIRTRKPDLLIDNGDFLQGSMLSAYCAQHPHIPHPMIQLANDLHYDCAILGNHEFQEPLASIQAMREQCHFPWIGCNIGDFAQPYVIKDIRGLKVAVLGVTTHHTPLWDEFGHLSRLHFEHALLATKRWVSHIRQVEQPDFLIVSYHGGFAEDPDGAWQFDQHTGENEGLPMLEIDGIDLLITGHQHLCLQGNRFGTAYIQPGSHGQWVAEISVSNACEGRWSIQSQMIPIAEELPNPPEVEAWLAEEIGYIPYDLTYSDQLDVIVNGHPYLDWFHEFQLAVTKADLSVTELFYNMSGGLHGRITRRDILTNYPRQHKLVVLELSGKAILEAVEQSAAALAINTHNEVDFAFRVYPSSLQPYLYDFWGGIAFEMDLTQPVQRRISTITIHGEPLLMDKTYTVAMNSFRALGNEFPMFHNAPLKYTSIERIPELLESYIRNKTFV